jgi:hypothetical protein
MARHNGFDTIETKSVVDCHYIKVSGLSEDTPLISLSKVEDIATLASRHFESLKLLLASYLTETTAYIPRHNMLKDDDRSDYDHLSRRLEWQLRGYRP